MTVNSIYLQYAAIDGNGNGQADGYKSHTVNGNEVLFEEVTGETFTVTLTDAEIAQLTGAQATQETAPAAQTTETTNETSAEIQERIDKLNAEKAETLEMMTAIEDTIDDLAAQATEKIQEAKELQEAKMEAYQESVKVEVQKNIAAYIAANKDGNGMTQEELQANVESSVNGVAPDLGSVVSGLFVANSQIALIDAHVKNLKNLAGTVQTLESEISVAQTEFDTAKAAEEAAAAAKSCDPIGFKDAQGNTFDFVVMDEDGFNTTSDFLGAENNWDAMVKLDTKGADGSEGSDGIVSLDELRDAGIALTMNGSKDLMDADAIAKMFGDDFQIDLGTYDKNGTFDGITDVDSDGNDVIDQDLQGTFKITAGGKEIDGYNTLDDQEWLAEKYKIEADVDTVDGVSAGAKAAATEGPEASEELAQHLEKIAGYEQTVIELRAQLEAQWTLLGLDKENIDEMDAYASAQATKQADDFLAQLEAQKAAEAPADNEEAPVEAPEGAGEAGEEDQDPEDRREDEE